MAGGGVLVLFRSPDGEEREESWPSLARFLSWAMVQDQPYAYTAYSQDDDGEWVVMETGRTRAGRSPV